MSIDFMALAKEKSASAGNNNNNYFTLADGETKIIRFLTGLESYQVVKHDCCDVLMDTRSALWEAADMGGAPVTCPQCGQPLSREHIVYERPGVLGAGMHKFVPCANGQHGTFVCLGSPDNSLAGWVPAAPNGAGMYPCPICSSPQNQGERGPKPPAFRLFGVVVEREAEEEVVVVNGVPTTVVKGIKDVMEAGDDGVLRPKVSIVDMGHKSFWSKFDNALQDRNISIACFDWKVSRVGSKFDTTYDVQRMNVDAPQIIDMRAYEQFMPDIEGMLKRMGDPGYYYKKGWPVQGYTPQPEDMPQPAQQTQPAYAPQQPAQVPQQFQAHAAQPVPAQPAYAPQPMTGQPTPQPVPMPPNVAGANDWSVVAGQQM